MRRFRNIFLRFIIPFGFTLSFSAFTFDAPAQQDPKEKTEQTVITLKEKARKARLFFVRKQTRKVNVDEFEVEFLKQPEIKQWSLLITREELKADLVIEIHRKLFTRKYTITVIDPETNIVLFGGKIHDTIFENVEHSLVRRFVERMKKARDE
jgi:hypothetical protein